MTQTATTTSATQRASLQATFRGRATVTTSSVLAPGPFRRDITMGLRFTGSKVTITDLLLVQGTIPDTPFGPITVRMTMVGGGVGNYNDDDDSIVLPVTLRFDCNNDLLDTVLSLTLRTSGSGSPVEPDGDVTLVGSGTLSGGLPHGTECDVTLKGTITPSPVS